MTALSLELLDAIVQVVVSLPAGHGLRLGEIARRIGAPIEEVEPALVHLMARGQIRFQRHRQTRPHESGIR